MPGTTTAASPQWAYLPVEVLRNISRRLHAASDAIRFYDVCCAWRDTLCHDDEEYEPPYLLPWLLAPSTAAADDLEDQRCRCIFSKATYRAPGICVRDRRVAYADGTAAWVVHGHKETFLVNPLTAGRLIYPAERFNDEREWLHRRHRVVSGDGAVLVYDFDQNPPDDDYPCRRFRANYLRPGEEKWHRVSSDLSTADRCCAAAYYYGNVVCVDLANCHVLWPYREPIGQYYYIERTREVRAELPDEPGKVRRCSYLLEDYGRLLLASVLQEAGSTVDRPASGLSVSLHELHLKAGENAGEEERVVEWVRRDESDYDLSLLGEDVLFLGFPVSFLAEAAWFGGEQVTGGTAYFVIEDSLSAGGQEPCSVYRYSFRDGVAMLVETLPTGWQDARCMWFYPEPQIVIDRCDEGTPATCNSTGTQRQELRIYAGDLSPKVDNSRLREMFSVYGKVASTRVAYDKRGRPRGFGFVTMATQEGFDKAMAALNAVEEPRGSLINPFNLFVMLLILLMVFVLR